MARYAPDRRGHREDNRQAGGATVEEVVGDHQHGTPARLLMPPRRVEVGEPHFAAGGALTAASGSVSGGAAPRKALVLPPPPGRPGA